MKVKDIILESYEMITNDTGICSADDLTCQFDTFLNSINEPVIIMDQEFTPAEALKKMSPFQYEEKFKAWKIDNRICN